MSLWGAIEFAKQLRKELVLYNLESGDSIEDRLKTHFDTQNVEIVTVQTASGAPRVGILSNRDEVLTIVDVSILRELVDGTSARQGGVGISDAEYKQILTHLKETTFTSYDKEQLLYASREIEDRARRVGFGTIHAGFQRISRMDDQQSIYADLARRGIEVHAYGVPDAAPPDLDTGCVHPIDTDEIARMWFVVFDGNGDDNLKSALIAEERETDVFYGVWTYDPRLVDRVCEYLEQTYVDTSEKPSGQTRQ